MADCIVCDLLRDARHDGRSASDLLRDAQIRKGKLAAKPQPDERHRVLIDMAIELVIDKLFAEAIAEAIEKGVAPTA
jgi:hypothetical protein